MTWAVRFAMFKVMSRTPLRQFALKILGSVTPMKLA